MLRVAAFAKLLIQNWNGPHIDEYKIISGLLLHDLGNIVKIAKGGLGMEEGDLLYRNWNRTKNRFIRKYGADDQLTTFNILTELGIPDDVRHLVINKLFILNERTASIPDFNLKISAYCDQRVAPYSIDTLKNRLDEAKERSKGKPFASLSHPRATYMLKAAFEIEAQILQYTSLPDLNTINKIVEATKDELRSHEIYLNYLDYRNNHVEAVVETPKGSSFIYKMGRSSYYIEKVLPADLPFIHNYGYVPNTFVPDQEELDVFILNKNPIQPGTANKIRVLGGIKMIEDGKEDNKLISVIAHDEAHANLNSIKDIRNDEINAITDYLTKYKNYFNQSITIQNVFDRYEAVSLIHNARKV